MEVLQHDDDREIPTSKGRLLEANSYAGRFFDFLRTAHGTAQRRFATVIFIAQRRFHFTRECLYGLKGGLKDILVGLSTAG